MNHLAQHTNPLIKEKNTCLESCKFCVF